MNESRQINAAERRKNGTTFLVTQGVPCPDAFPFFYMAGIPRRPTPCHTFQKRVENNVLAKTEELHVVQSYHSIVVHDYPWMCAKPRKNIHISDIFLIVADIVDRLWTISAEAILCERFTATIAPTWQTHRPSKFQLLILMILLIAAQNNLHTFPRRILWS